MTAVQKKWFVYILECANQTLYTGITRDLDRRIKEHNCKKGSRYTRAFGPVKLIWSETMRTRSKALKREAQIKRLSREQKLILSTENTSVESIRKND